MLDYQLTFQHGILYVNPTWFHYVKNNWEAWANQTGTFSTVGNGLDSQSLM